MTTPPLVNGVSFTGSTATGDRVRCTASSRLIVMDAVYDEFVDISSWALAPWPCALARRRPGAGTDIGPVVDERQLAQDERYLALAAADGGEVIGWERLERAKPGFYLSPAVLLGTANEDTVNREEIFGPVASVARQHRRARVRADRQRIAPGTDDGTVIADGCSNRGIVVGEFRPLPDVPLTSLEARLRRADVLVGSCRPGATMDDPMVSLERLNTRLAEYGRSVTDGQRVVTGSITKAAVDGPGPWSGEIDGLGSVELTFV
ncbi:MAG TPA: aldehyde dehydrogenase family protein [Pseudonocardiaceae bacterium]|nr:aldehyde dehydrogenase family protein [Pseudonocardiaceae bacterium]